MKRIWIIGLLTSVGLFGRPVQPDSDNGGRLWILFRDKGQTGLDKAMSLESGLELGLTPKALQRRNKVLPRSQAIDATDLPVHDPYIDRLESLGVEVLCRSRWLNAVSVNIHETDIQDIKKLPFVKQIKPVAVYERSPPRIIEKPPSFTDSPSASGSLDYGASYAQNSLMRIPEIHDMGLNGNGVLIGLIDTGFDYKDRPVFSHIAVVDEYDFYWGDRVTSNEDGDSPSQDDHGTKVLSVIGGCREGELIGPAYKASYALAKTDWIPVSDYAIEEDYWIEALEWLEALGVDIVSSSLGYGSFVDKASYTLEDLDGNTALCTIAADIAVGKGVCVLNSAGNKDFWPKINFPADGDSVIAVGALSVNGVVAAFSSEGPTSDGRIKPDVMAMGLGVYAVQPTLEESYKYVSGTSFACPLVAGVSALILQAHPELNPLEVREALVNTASRAGDPDNRYGWGLVDAYEAVFYHGMIFTNFEWIHLLESNRFRMDMDLLNKEGVAENSVYLNFHHTDDGVFRRVQSWPSEGKNAHRYSTLLPPDFSVVELQFFIEASDTLGITHLAPRGAPDFLYGFHEDSPTVFSVVQRVPQGFILYQNYPNPFNLRTTLSFDVLQPGRITLRIIDVLGREVVILVDEVLETGHKRFVWTGIDSRNNPVPSGLYFCLIEYKGQTWVKKMIVSR